MIRGDPERPESADLAFSALELPAAPAQPYVGRRPDAPAGSLRVHQVRSAILGNERRVWLYTPPGYSPSGLPYPLLLVFDGKEYVDLIPTPTILDNLLAEGRLPPVVAVFPDSLGWCRCQADCGSPALVVNARQPEMRPGPSCHPTARSGPLSALATPLSALR